MSKKVSTASQIFNRYLSGCGFAGDSYHIIVRLGNGDGEAAGL
jgi:hypothetical protein